MADDIKPPDVSHASLRYVAGLLIAPLAWIVQTVIAETLAAQSCYPFDKPLPAPIVPWMRPALVGLGALCLMAGGLGAWIAWRNLRRIASLEKHTPAHALRTRTELVGFLSRIAAMCSVLFLFALIATDVALAIVSPCRWW